MPIAFGAEATWRSHVGIPIRNLWMLLAYSAGLAEFLDAADGAIDENTDLPELLARLLSIVVERRLRRGLSRGYQDRRAPLSRIRGRIDWLETESKLHLQRGLVACRFDSLTHDTPRNRLVRAALERLAEQVRDREVARSCTSLSRTLSETGVGPGLPSRADISKDRIARHDADDRLMVDVAKLAIDLVLPSEANGDTRLTRLGRDERLLWKIFEKAVAGFYRHELKASEWTVRAQPSLEWQTDEPTDRIEELLPSMAPDLMIDGVGRRIVVDTKFTGIIVPRQFGGMSFKSGHLFQLYAYLRSQSGRGNALADVAEGILLHPAVDCDVDEAVTIQGHRMRFKTVDLSQSGFEIRTALLAVLQKTTG